MRVSPQIGWGSCKIDNKLSRRSVAGGTRRHAERKKLCEREFTQTRHVTELRRPRSRQLGIPKPYVLAAERRGRDLMVAMTLFGFATEWAPTRPACSRPPRNTGSMGAASVPQLFPPRPEIDQVMVRAGSVSPIRNPPRQKHEEDSGSQSRFNLR